MGDPYPICLGDVKRTCLEAESLSDGRKEMLNIEVVSPTRKAIAPKRSRCWQRHSNVGRAMLDSAKCKLARNQKRKANAFSTRGVRNAFRKFESGCGAKLADWVLLFCAYVRCPRARAFGCWSFGVEEALSFFFLWFFVRVSLAHSAFAQRFSKAAAPALVGSGGRSQAAAQALGAAAALLAARTSRSRKLPPKLSQTAA